MTLDYNHRPGIAERINAAVDAALEAERAATPPRARNRYTNKLTIIIIGERVWTMGKKIAKQTYSCKKSTLPSHTLVSAQRSGSS